MIDIAIPRAAAEPRATVLVLRCCRADRVASKGFVWPESGPVACDDWSPEPVCGQGLHGWQARAIHRDIRTYGWSYSAGVSW